MCVDGASKSKELNLDEGLYAVISQSCDVTHHCFDSEPNVELLHVQEIKRDEVASDGNYTHGKNVRRLEFVCGGKNFRCFAKDRHILPRKHLINLRPCDIMENEVLKLWIYWVTRRYKRLAFPSEFERRIAAGKMKKKMSKLLGKHDKDIIGIFVSIACDGEPTNDDISSDKEYELYLRIFANENVYNDGMDELRKSLVDAVRKIAKLLGESEGIRLINDPKSRTDDELLAEMSLESISAAEYLSLNEWDFEYMSFEK